MAGKKIWPPRKAPPPPEAFAALRAEYETAELAPDVRILSDGILLCFDQQTQFVLMTAKGARELAAALTGKANELERKATTRKNSS